MIASAYCYHHRGEASGAVRSFVPKLWPGGGFRQELGYTTLWPPGLIMTMGPEDAGLREVSLGEDGGPIRA